jgi:glycosyltransferase involved in cell wall biosynthesis
MALRSARCSRGGATGDRHCHVALVVENVPFSIDPRVLKQIDDLLGAGYEVSIVTMRDERNQRHSGVPGLTVLEYPAPTEGADAWGHVREYASSFLWAVILVARLHRRHRIDILQVCQPPDIYFLMCLLLRSTGTRVLIDQRDLMPEVLAQRYARPSRAMLTVLGWLERQTQRSADRTVTVNGYLRDRLIAVGARPEHVSVVRNGPVLQRIERAVDDPSLRGAHRYLVCWVGKMGKQDRVDLVLQVARDVVFSLGQRDCGFMLIGDGECLEELRSAATDLGLDPWVTFPGWLPENRVFDYLASADLGLDTSLQVEVTPVKAMEYMALRLPLVSFDLQETRRVAQDAGVFVTPGDTAAMAAEVVHLLSRPETRRRLGDVGRLRVSEELAWERQSQTYLAVVRRLAETGRCH